MNGDRRSRNERNVTRARQGAAAWACVWLVGSGLVGSGLVGSGLVGSGTARAEDAARGDSAEDESRHVEGARASNGRSSAAWRQSAQRPVREPGLDASGANAERANRTRREDPGADADRVVRRIERRAVRLMHALAAARMRANETEVACVDRALTQLHSAERRARRRAEQLRQASAQPHDAARQHLRRVLRTIDTHARTVTRRGVRCAGSAISAEAPSGAQPLAEKPPRNVTVVEVIVEPEVPAGEDPTELPWR
jgi:hypothetical protein